MATRPSLLPARMLYAATSLALTLVARAEADVTLRLSQPAYEVGEIVFFTLTNESKCVITLPHAIGWWHIYDSQGARVGGCLVAPAEYDLYPGWSLTDSWDQRLCPEGPQVPEGRYRLAVGYRSEDCPPGSVAAYFQIGMVPVEPTSWGHIKAVFRER